MSPRFGLVGPSYESQSPNLDAQATINFYVEQDESGAGNAPIALMPTPGIQSFTDLTPPPPPEGTGLQNTRIVLSAAQLRASGITPISLLPAPGANRVIIVLSATIQYNFVSIPYTSLNGGALNPVIGLGNTVADVQNSFVVTVNSNSFKDLFSTIQQVTGSNSWNNLSPNKFVDLPLLWADQFDPSSSTGDGTATVNIQYYVLDVTTGALVGGSGKVHISTIQMTAAQFKAANTVPVQLVAAPGANQVIVPINAVIWHHFNGTAFSSAALPIVGYGTVVADIITSQIFHALDSNSFLFAADSMEQQIGTFYPLSATDIIPTKAINQPLSWVNTSDVSADPGNTSATIYTMYLVIDVTTGDFIQGSGTMFSKRTSLTAAQVKAAFTTGIPIVSAPGVNLLLVEQYATAQVNFVTTPYGGGDQPEPRIAPAATAVNAVKRGLLRLSSTGGGISLWTSGSTQMLLESITFYVPASSTPG